VESAALRKPVRTVDLALDILKQSGRIEERRQALQNAEIRMRALLRRIDNFRLKLSGDHWRPRQSARSRPRAHDELMDAVLGR
jgi:hypothetical protein